MIKLMTHENWFMRKLHVFPCCLTCSGPLFCCCAGYPKQVTVGDREIKIKEKTLKPIYCCSTNEEVDAVFMDERMANNLDTTSSAVCGCCFAHEAVTIPGSAGQQPVVLLMKQSEATKFKEAVKMKHSRSAPDVLVMEER